MENHTKDQNDSVSQSLDLSPSYAVIRFTGSESLEFLQRQLSNNVAALSSEIAQVNAYLTPKGRVIALLTLILHEKDVLALVDRQMVELIGQTLQRFVIRADVKILAPDPQWQIVGQIAPSETQDALKLDALTVSRDSAAITLQWPGNRQIVLNPTSSEQSIGSDPATQSMRRWQQLDIEHRLARIGPAETEQFIAQMLLLDSLQVINFKKGCYPGQEVVARAHYRGRIKRTLVQYQSAKELEPGTTLSIQDDGALKPVGKTLQCIASGEQSWLGLAVIHESGIEAQQLVSAADPSVEVRIF